MSKTAKARIKKKPKQRIYVFLTARWGNGDANSMIKVSRRRWTAICNGAIYQTTAWSRYEGSRYSVVWTFDDAHFSIDEPDSGAQHIADCPVEEIFTEVS